MGAWTGRFPASSALEVEAKAARQACVNLESVHCDKVLIEGDALNVVNALNVESSSVCWRFFSVINQAQEYLHIHGNWKCIFVGREGNGCPHFLAKWAAFSNCFGTINISLLPPLYFVMVVSPLLFLIDY